MGMSPHVAWLRSKVGSELLILPSVTILIENDRGEILIVRNMGVDTWATLGGGVEPMEQPEVAAVREVKEEVGLDVELIGLAGVVGGPECLVVYPNGDRVSYVTSVYRAQVADGQNADDAAPDQIELDAIRWVAPSDLADVNLDNFARFVFDQLGYLQTTARS